MKQLTPRQREVLRFIEEFIEWNDYAPTLEEVARHMGVSKPTAQQYVQALEQKEAIRRTRYAHRSIEPARPGAQAASTELPLLGRIAAGQPFEAFEHREVVNIADALGVKSRASTFLLQVKGDSMVEDGILDGDYVVVEKRQTARNGETVVALLEDKTVTLKRFYREKDRIRLQPANPTMQPIYVKEVTIQGVLRGVLRLVK